MYDRKSARRIGVVQNPLVRPICWLCSSQLSSTSGRVMGPGQTLLQGGLSPSHRESSISPGCQDEEDYNESYVTAWLLAGLETLQVEGRPLPTPFELQVEGRPLPTPFELLDGTNGSLTPRP